MKSASREDSSGSCHMSHVTCHRSAFTLIELLAVIAIIGALAALLLAVAGPVKKKQYIFQARAEMERLETAIGRYKAAYGFYPPDNRIKQTNQYLIHQLYYELTGVIYTNKGDGLKYYSLNDPSILPLTGSQVNDAFDVGGFMNCTKPGGGEEVGKARNFLPDLREKQVWNRFTNNSVPVTLLITAVGGPDQTYQPLNLPDVNPWRYNSSNPTNNPGAYDLWIQLKIGGKTNLICNWSKEVKINSPIP
jgi:prepilin-type N-terminal cleavage/methylation domain-containing protein